MPKRQSTLSRWRHQLWRVGNKSQKVCTLVVPQNLGDFVNRVIKALIFMMWCRRGESNPHELPHTPLKRARLPVPPLRLMLSEQLL